MNTPRVILSADALEAADSPAEAVEAKSGSRPREVWHRQVVLTQLRDLGFSRLSFGYSPELLTDLRSLAPERRFDLFPVVPNIDRHGRMFQNYGLPGAALRMLRELRPGEMLQLGSRVPRHPDDLLRRDFGGLVSLLTLFEIERLRPLRPRAVLLHPLVSDLMLANRHFEFLARFGKLVSGSLGAPAGVMTGNLGWMLRELDEFGVPEIKLVAGPANIQGDGMRPSQSTCENAIAATGRSVIATRVAPDSPSTPVTTETLSYLASLGVDAMLLDVGSAVAAYQLRQTLAAIPHLQERRPAPRSS